MNAAGFSGMVGNQAQALQALVAMKPGTYILKHNVENPTPNRRHRHDWRMKPLGEKGARFTVHEQESMADERKILFVKSGSYAIYSYEPRFELLTQALERINESPRDWLRRESVNPGLEALAILDTLAARGAITLADVQEISKALEAEAF